MTNSNLLKCGVFETNWNKIYLDEITFYEPKIQKTTFTYLDFNETYPTLINIKNGESITIKNLNQAIKKCMKIID